MDKVRLALILITIAIVAGPVLVMVLAYQNNLKGLIVPPEINQIIDSLSNRSDNTQPIVSGPPEVQYDPTSHIATVTFQLQDPLPFDVTLSSMNGTVVCDEHNFPLGTASLKNPVDLKVGETSTVTVLMVFTQNGVDHLQMAHASETNVKVSLIDSTITAGGLTVQSPDRISIGEIPKP